MKFRPLYDRVLVEKFEKELETKAGIIIPEDAADEQIKGNVVAVGKGKLLEDGYLAALSVSVGDAVLFSKFAGTDLAIDGGDFIILKEDDIVGVLVRSREDK